MYGRNLFATHEQAEKARDKYLAELNKEQGTIMKQAKQGRHLSNTYDPTIQDAKVGYSYSYYARLCGQSMMDYEWQTHLDWINENVVGEPEGCDDYTVQQLKDKGMIGIYSKVKEPV